MTEEKVTYQMALDFEAIGESVSANCKDKLNNGNPHHTLAVVVSLQELRDKREKERQAALYGQIASSVAHLISM